MIGTPNPICRQPLKTVTVTLRVRHFVPYIKEGLFFLYCMRKDAYIAKISLFFEFVFPSYTANDTYYKRMRFYNISIIQVIMRFILLNKNHFKNGKSIELLALNARRNVFACICSLNYKLQWNLCFCRRLIECSTRLH